MKLFVDKMPHIPGSCLFSKRECGDDWKCMFTKRVCKDTAKCRYLKTNRGSSFLEKEFHMDVPKQVCLDFINDCRCGSGKILLCHTGNPLSGMFYVRCDECDKETEYYSSREEAVENWNKQNEIYTPYIYQVDATRTADPALSAEKKILEGLVGINSEAGEALDIWKKYEFHKHDLDKKAIALELGDVLWYLTEAAVALGYSLEDIMKMNIEKLSKRYPDGFDPERSKNREE